MNSMGISEARVRNSLLVMVSTTMVGLGNCGGAGRQLPPPPPSPEVSISAENITAAQHTIINWLECEECNAGELESVKLLGAGNMHDQIVEILVLALNEGPARATGEIEKRALERSYDRLLAYAQDHPESAPKESKEDYVARFLDNYRATYQLRAASALAEIGGSTAFQALQEASTDGSVRPDVKAVLDDLLQSFPQPTPP